MRIKVNEASAGVEALPAILDSLPSGLSAWVSKGSALVMDGDVEIARVPIRGLSTAEAAEAVSNALKGVV